MDEEKGFNVIRKKPSASVGKSAFTTKQGVDQSMKYPEEIKAYNKRHGIEVKVALDVLRQYVIGLDNVKGQYEYPCDYCIMENVCFELFGKCCPTVFEYHRDAATDEITCVTPSMDCDMVVRMDEDEQEAYDETR